MHRQFLVLALLFSTLAHDSNGTTSLVQSYELSRGGSLSPSCNRVCLSRQSGVFTFTIKNRGLRCRGGDTDVSRRLLQKPSFELSLAKVTNMDSDGDTNTEKYHLIWSRNFWKKMVASLLCWAFLWSIQKKINLPSGAILFNDSHATCHHDKMLTEMSRELSMKIVLPLLSSSCCAIQLVINAISGLGCAGFNTYLGKAKPSCEVDFRPGALILNITTPCFFEIDD